MQVLGLGYHHNKNNNNNNKIPFPWKVTNFKSNSSKLRPIKSDLNTILSDAPKVSGSLALSSRPRAFQRAGLSLTPRLKHQFCLPHGLSFEPLQRVNSDWDG